MNKLLKKYNNSPPARMQGEMSNQARCLHHVKLLLFNYLFIYLFLLIFGADDVVVDTLQDR